YIANHQTKIMILCSHQSSYTILLAVVKPAIAINDKVKLSYIIRFGGVKIIGACLRSARGAIKVLCIGLQTGNADSMKFIRRGLGYTIIQSTGGESPFYFANARGSSIPCYDNAV